MVTIVTNGLMYEQNAYLLYKCDTNLMSVELVTTRDLLNIILFHMCVCLSVSPSVHLSARLLVYNASMFARYIVISLSQDDENWGIYFLSFF